MTNTTPSPTSLSLADRIDISCDQFEAQWATTDSLSIERVVAQFADAESDSALSELVAVEMELRFRNGETISMESYLSRFPRQHRAIESVFDTVLAELMVTQTSSNASSKDDAGQGDNPAVTSPPGSGVPQSSQFSGQAEADSFPAQIGKYRIVQALGRGGQATVYRAVHPTLGRDVVIKFCHAATANDPAARESLRSEGRVLAELDHPNLAKVYDFDFDQGRPFLVMEFVRGLNLAQYAKQHRCSTGEWLRLMIPIAEALAYVHARGVLHLDIKPQNILIDDEGRPRLIDFGLARTESAWEQSGPDADKLSGTLAFMAPEQANCEGDKVGPQSDVYGLGGVLYFLLIGKPPLINKTFAGTLSKARLGDWDRTALQENVDEAVRNVIERSMAKEPTQRYESADAFGSELRRLSPVTPSNASANEKKKVAFGLTSMGCALQLTIAFTLALIILVPGYKVYQYVTAQAGRVDEVIGFPSPQSSSLPSPPSTHQSALTHLQVRLWRNGSIFDLTDSAPVGDGDRVEIRSNVSSQMHVSLFLFDSEGKLALVDSRPPGSPPGYRFPANPTEFEQIVGPSGTEFVFLCARRESLVTVEELLRIDLFSSAWPQLPEDTVVEITSEKVEFAQRGRGFGGGVGTVDPQQVVFDRIEQLRQRMLETNIVVCGVAFAHAE